MLHSIFTLALVTAVCAQDWTVTVYDGLRCTGRALEHHETSSTNDPDAPVCVGPLAVNTASLVFAVSESATTTYILELHEDNDCVLLDALPGSGAILSPGDRSYCLNANAANYFYIQSEAAASIVRNVTAVTDASDTTALAIRETSELAELAELAQLPFSVTWTLGAIGLSITVAEALRNRCESFGATTGDSILCGAYISASIAGAALVAAQYAGLFQEPAAPAAGGRHGLLGHDLLPLLDPSVHSVSSKALFEGATTILTKMPAEHIVARNLDGAEDTWLHLFMQLVDDETGATIDCNMDIDTKSNRTLLASTPHSSSDNLGKRQASQATGYYSYDNLDLDLMSGINPSIQTAWELGSELWDYMQAEDDSQACANIMASGADGLLHPANRGFVSIITGQFFDELEGCPY